MSAIVEQHEEFSCGPDRRLVVAKRATRARRRARDRPRGAAATPGPGPARAEARDGSPHWFVLEISSKGSEVHGPVLDWAGLSTHEYAVREALAMYARAPS
jgi:hypothetical protein